MRAGVAVRRRRRGLRRVVRSEWTKIRTVRSTRWALAASVVVGGGVAGLLGASLRDGRVASVGREGAFDPLFASCYGLTLAQLALVVFAVLVVGGEYGAGSGTIRASLAATPGRGRFYAGKVVAAGVSSAVAALVTVGVAFVVGQAALGPRGVALGEGDTVRTLVGSWLYLTLVPLLALGVAALVRSSARALGVLLPLLFLGSQGAGNVPGVRVVAQYLPDQAGLLITHFAGPPDAPFFDRAYGPWTGLGILAAWTAAALAAGCLVLRYRDAT